MFFNWFLIMPLQQIHTIHCKILVINNQIINQILIPETYAFSNQYIFSEAVVQRCSVKQMFLKILQNLQ